MVDPRARGEGLPVPRHGRQAPVPRIDAEDHGDHGPDEPDHGPRPAGAERILKGAGPRCEGPPPSSPGEPLLAPRIDDLTESFPERREARRPPEVLPESRVRRARGGVQKRDGVSARDNPREPQGDLTRRGSPEQAGQRHEELRPRRGPVVHDVPYAPARPAPAATTMAAAASSAWIEDQTASPDPRMGSFRFMSCSPIIRVRPESAA